MRHLAALLACALLAGSATAQTTKRADTPKDTAATSAPRSPAADDMAAVPAAVSVVCGIMALLLIDLIPIGIAIGRGHPDTGAIIVALLLLGCLCWPVVWVFCLAWSLKGFNRRVIVVRG